MEGTDGFRIFGAVGYAATTAASPSQKIGDAVLAFSSRSCEQRSTNLSRSSVSQRRQVEMQVSYIAVNARSAVIELVLTSSFQMDSLDPVHSLCVCSLLGRRTRHPCTLSIARLPRPQTRQL